MISQLGCIYQCIPMITTRFPSQGLALTRSPVRCVGPRYGGISEPCKELLRRRRATPCAVAVVRGGSFKGTPSTAPKGWGKSWQILGELKVGDMVNFFFCFAFLRWRDFTMRRCFFLNGVIAIHLLIIGATTGLKQQFEWWWNNGTCGCYHQNWK